MPSLDDVQSIERGCTDFLTRMYGELDDKEVRRQMQTIWYMASAAMLKNVDLIAKYGDPLSGKLLLDSFHHEVARYAHDEIAVAIADAVESCRVDTHDLGNGFLMVHIRRGGSTDEDE